MKKIVFLFLMSFAVYSVNAQTCTPDLVVDDVSMTATGTQLTFDWIDPWTASGGPPPPPGGTYYSILVEYGAMNPFGFITWGYYGEKVPLHVQFAGAPQSFTTTALSSRIITHVRISIKFLTSPTCENSWATFEFPL